MKIFIIFFSCGCVHVRDIPITINNRIAYSDNPTERTDHGYVHTPDVFNGENFPVYGTTHFYITTYLPTTTHHVFWSITCDGFQF